MPHEHRLRRLPVGKFVEQLDRRSVSGVQTRDHRGALNGKNLSQPRAQFLGQIIHGMQRDRSALIHPSNDLICAKAGNLMFPKRGGKRLLCPAENIHRRLMRAMKNPSGPSVSGII